MAAIRPACAGEPVTAKINHGKAINETCDPIAETICPLHSSKKSRLCHNEAGRAGIVRVFGIAFPLVAPSELVRFIDEPAGTRNSVSAPSVYHRLLSDPTANPPMPLSGSSGKP